VTDQQRQEAPAPQAADGDEPEVLARVVTGVIGVDAHVTGNWIVGQSLRSAGFDVVSLGVCVPQEDFIEAAVETNADAIWVTSLYGHALLDCEGFRERCVEMGVGEILLYIGGMLVVGKHDWPTVERQFRDAGFDRAYPPNSLPETAMKDLLEDLQARRNENERESA
jgi:methylaspartate mutase sigma subunit